VRPSGRSRARGPPFARTAASTTAPCAFAGGYRATRRRPRTRPAPRSDHTRERRRAAPGARPGERGSSERSTERAEAGRGGGRRPPLIQEPNEEDKASRARAELLAREQRWPMWSMSRCTADTEGSSPLLSRDDMEHMVTCSRCGGAAGHHSMELPSSRRPSTPSPRGGESNRPPSRSRAAGEAGRPASRGAGPGRRRATCSAAPSNLLGGAEQLARCQHGALVPQGGGG
jgi:hypothetical protein